MLIRLLHFSTTLRMVATSFILLIEIFLLIDTGRILVSGTESGASCSYESMAACQAPFSPLLDNQVYVIAVNKTQLLGVCDKLKKALDCVDDFLGRCLEVERNEMDKFFSGYKTFLHNVCQVDSNFSKEYLRHAPCMAEADDQIHSCMNDSRFRLVNPMSNALTSTYTTSDILDTVCCVMKHFLTCSENVYGAHCGEDASRLGHQTLLTMLGPTIQNVCMDNEGLFKCSNAHHLHSASAVTSLITLTTAILVIYSTSNKS